MILSKRDIKYYTIGAVIVVLTCIIVSCTNGSSAQYTTENNQENISTKATQEEIKLYTDNQVAECMIDDMDFIYDDWEDPLEAEKIEEALVEQGYFSYDIPLTFMLQDDLRTACVKYDVDYTLALGVIEVESNFAVDAVGVDGQDIGLFQIRKSNHSWLEGETGKGPMTVSGNIECGVYFLHYLLGRYSTVEAALTAYRWGHDNGTRSYANSVLSAAGRWAELGIS